MNPPSRLQNHTRSTQNQCASQPYFLLFLAVSMALTLWGCIGLTSAGTPSNSGSNSNGSSGTLAASATSLSFGNTSTGSVSSQNLTLTNTGTAMVTISQGTVTGAGFNVVGGMSSITIAGGQNHVFQVQFAPTAVGSASGGISIASNATDSLLSISLSGTGMSLLAITTQPASETVTAGQTATFSVAATGNGTLAYQWKKNGAVLPGATAASYATPAATMADNGSEFSVVVTDSTGSVTSNQATLSVTAAPVAPTITAQPADQTVSAGQAATFDVSATGTGPLSYQWNKNGAPVTGATASSYTTPSTASADDGASYSVAVSNAVGSAKSTPATLHVKAPPSIVTQPADQTVNAGQSATFSVTATGAGSLKYQWEKNGAALLGAISASYTTSPTTPSDNGAKFQVVLTDKWGSVTSNSATLTVTAAAVVAPTITTQPAGQTVIAGQSATFSVAATGTGPLAYQWQKNSAPIGGANSASYTTPAESTTDNGAQFTVTVKNAAGSATSSAAILTVNAATLVLNASPSVLAFASVTVGNTSVLPVTFTNAGNSNVTISNVSISGAGFTASGLSSGQILTPGQPATLNVTFAPSTAVAATGSVTITSNATNSPAVITLTGLGVQPISHSAALSWTASTSTVVGYNVYRSTTSGGPYTRLNATPVTATSYADSTVQSGQTYYYVATSVDSNGLESIYSPEVSATIP